jgi:pimeloyl-ACP methyl ester carboxylesterase
MDSKPIIIFIHGLFMNPTSWQAWIDYFSARGYECYAPAYPYHEGHPAALKNNPSIELGKVHYKQVVQHYEKVIATMTEKPILIGHSMGGLIVQTLINRGLGKLGIAIDSAPPKGIITFKWSFYKANLPTVNPFKGDRICLPDVDWFHYAFCNVLTLSETQSIYDQFVVPESRNIPRSSGGKAGAIDFKKTHEPLLIIAGEKDTIIPSSLNKSNWKAYSSTAGICEFIEFPNRSHILCNQDGWQEIAAYCEQWINKQL